MFLLAFLCFRFRLLISLDISISYRDMSKELVSLKIVSEAVNNFRKNKLKTFCCLEKAKFVTVFEKKYKSYWSFFKVNAYSSGDSFRCMGFQYNIAYR